MNYNEKQKYVKNTFSFFFIPRPFPPIKESGQVLGVVNVAQRDLPYLLNLVRCWDLICAQTGVLPT